MSFFVLIYLSTEFLIFRRFFSRTIFSNDPCISLSTRLPLFLSIPSNTSLRIYPFLIVNSFLFVIYCKLFSSLSTCSNFIWNKNGIELFFCFSFFVHNEMYLYIHIYIYIKYIYIYIYICLREENVLLGICIPCKDS